MHGQWYAPQDQISDPKRSPGGGDGGGGGIILLPGREMEEVVVMQAEVEGCEEIRLLLLTTMPTTEHMRYLC